VARIDLEAGSLSIGEPGNRTRYFEDLVSWGCPVTVGSSYVDLVSKALRRAPLA
jgi:hypothetical protein